MAPRNDEQSLEREHELAQSSFENVHKLIALTQYSMMEKSSVREKDCRDQQQQVVPGQNVMAAFERSIEREHKADRELIATANNAMTQVNNAMTQVNNAMTQVARCRSESSVREKDFQSFLSSCTEQPPAFHDQQ
jgi:hypothetical protein